MKTFITALLALSLTACAVNGPGPANYNYDHALRQMEVKDSIEYSVKAAWFPDVMLGSVMSFHSSHVPGRLFITDEQLVFAVFDGSTDTFLEGYTVAYNELEWLTSKRNGRSTLVRLQSDNSVNSFMLYGDLHKVAADYILERVH